MVLLKRVYDYERSEDILFAQGGVSNVNHAHFITKDQGKRLFIFIALISQIALYALTGLADFKKRIRIILLP
ncbi:hypothetical protein N473_21775 [Pseudoalteromonas luteoviolacea CPMOR-1]|uniref:Uncharacterized protein n=1 Tax=Pseudoalteromonas luteoviolacea CPMOR-1 TaxID=1365248 RepID=A0A162AMC1_9GAMM|nr:hypothetical protein N473_21775 [Pseudoalteromonas luteoviolacea CPMOR-1]